MIERPKIKKKIEYFKPSAKENVSWVSEKGGYPDKGSDAVPPDAGHTLTLEDNPDYKSHEKIAASMSTGDWKHRRRWKTTRHG